MTITEALNDFLLACEADGLAPSTVKWYQSLLKPFAASHGDTNLQDVSPRMMREYIRSGGDISTLARLLGHADVQTTHQYYAVFSPDELQVMHDKHISFEEWLQDE